jgi:hypothetical protein
MNRVLVVGLPRSGTTWVGRVLAASDGTEYLGEPDNPLGAPFALRTCRRLGVGHFPLLSPDAQASEYERLWACAFGLASIGTVDRVRRAAAHRLLRRIPPDRVRAALRSATPGLPLWTMESLAAPEGPDTLPSNLVVKSVNAPLSVEWIAHRFRLQIAVVLRNPLSILSSWAELEWLGRPGDDMLDHVAQSVQDELVGRLPIPRPPREASVIARAAWMIGAITCALTDAAARNPAWPVVTHEELCETPGARYPVLASALGLRWGVTADEALVEMNRPGQGGEPFRVASELADVWRSRLSVEHVAEARSVLDQFALDERLVSHAS